MIVFLEASAEKVDVRKISKCVSTSFPEPRNSDSKLYFCLLPLTTAFLNERSGAGQVRSFSTNLMFLLAVLLAKLGRGLIPIQRKKAMSIEAVGSTNIVT